MGIVLDQMPCPAARHGVGRPPHPIAHDPMLAAGSDNRGARTAR